MSSYNRTILAEVFEPDRGEVLATFDSVINH